MRSNPGGENVYAVIVEEEGFWIDGDHDPEIGEYENFGVKFLHQEADGATVCLSRALRAWIDAR